MMYEPIEIDVKEDFIDHVERVLYESKEEPDYRLETFGIMVSMVFYFPHLHDIIRYEGSEYMGAALNGILLFCFLTIAGAGNAQFEGQGVEIPDKPNPFSTAGGVALVLLFSQFIYIETTDYITKYSPDEGKKYSLHWVVSAFY